MKSLANWTVMGSIVVAAGCPLFDTDQGGQLVGSRQQRQFVGDDFIDPLIAKQLDEIGADAAPMRFDDVTRVDLERVESFCQTTGRRTERFGEYVPQTMCSISGNDQRSQATLGRPGGRCCGSRGLSDAALARVENEPHRANVSRWADHALF